MNHYIENVTTSAVWKELNACFKSVVAFLDYICKQIGYERWDR